MSLDPTWRDNPRYEGIEVSESKEAVKTLSEFLGLPDGVELKEFHLALVRKGK